jgi:hypothetical protein
MQSHDDVMEEELIMAGFRKSAPRRALVFLLITSNALTTTPDRCFITSVKEEGFRQVIFNDAERINFLHH